MARWQLLRTMREARIKIGRLKLKVRVCGCDRSRQCAKLNFVQSRRVAWIYNSKLQAVFGAIGTVR